MRPNRVWKMKERSDQRRRVGKRCVSKGWYRSQEKHLGGVSIGAENEGRHVWLIATVGILLAFIFSHHCILIRWHGMTCVGNIKTRRYHTNRYQTLTCYLVGILANCVVSTSLCLVLQYQPVQRKDSSSTTCAGFWILVISRHQSTTKIPPSIYHATTTATLTFVSISSWMGISVYPLAFIQQGPTTNSFQQHENEANSQNRQFAAICNEISAIRNQTKINDLYHASPRRFVLIPT